MLPKPVYLLPSRYDQVGQLEREPGERRGCGECCPAGFICRRCEEPGIEAASEYLLPPTATRLSSNGEDRECIQHLRLTDPRDDKKRIEETKGGLLEDSYHWILENSDFQQWRNDQQSRLLWIKGDPGKGKTTLLCGIVNELKKSMAKTDLLSYFFCQATDSRINNATAVLRGLLYSLVDLAPNVML